MTSEQFESALSVLHDAVVKIDLTLNDGLKAMVAEHRAELKNVNGAVQTIRDQVSSHIAKEDVIFEIFRRTLSVGVGITGVLVLTLFSIIGWLLTHPNNWINP